MSDTYAKIDCVFVRCTSKAVLITANEGEHWIPRSCIHGADEQTLDDASYGDEINLRIFEWLADRDDLR